MLESALEIGSVYVLAATAAYAIHLTAGVVSVGLEEVQRQQAVFLDRHGYRGLVVFILTAGVAFRGEEIEGGEPA